MDRHALALPNAPRSPFADVVPAERPDVAVAALPLLTRLRDGLRAAAAAGQDRWGVPKLFFFDRSLQAELNTAREGAADLPSLPPELNDLIDDARTVLAADHHARRAARAVAGLREAAAAVARVSKAIRELADLLALADDEVIRVICPAARAGCRVAVRGAADVHQLHVLLANALTGDPGRGMLAGSRPHPRVLAACSDPGTDPDGVEFTARYQFFRPPALQPDGSLPHGFRGSDHWVWGPEWVTDLPLVDGERAVLLGEPAFAATWEVGRRVPGVAAEVALLEVMPAAAVADWIAARTGRRPAWTEAAPVRRAA